MAVICPDEPGTILSARMSAPLILGVGVGEHFIASDIPAFLPYTRDVVFLEDGEIVRITDATWQVLSLETLEPVRKEVQTVQWDMQAARKGGFKHFMLKEIFEQPKVISDCLAGRVDEEKGMGRAAGARRASRPLAPADHCLRDLVPCGHVGAAPA